MGKLFDDADKDSIYQFAKTALGKSIRELVEVNEDFNPEDKGAVGNLIQKYFGLERNSVSEPDFPDAPLELKSFGFWLSKTGGRADQRLALSGINYMEYAKRVPFEESHLYRKCHSMLFMAFLLELEKARIDSEIKYARLYELDEIVKADLNQIVRDYEYITKKIRAGQAYDLSEGDTEYLGAARRGGSGSDYQEAPKGVKALPRRFAFKQSYMSYLVREYLIPERDFSEPIPRLNRIKKLDIPTDKPFDEWLDALDQEYRDMPAKELSRIPKIKMIAGRMNWSAKGAYSKLGFAMLGIRSNGADYLRKTNTVVKTIRIKKNGNIAEQLSFPTFSVADVTGQKWDESEVFDYLSGQRFLLLLFLEDEKDYIYKGHLFLKFTPEQLDEWVKPTWEDFQRKVRNGISFELEKTKSAVRIHSDILGKTSGQIGVIKIHARDTTYNIAREHIHGRTDQAEHFIDAHTVDGRFLLNPEKSSQHGDILPNGDIFTKQSFWLNKDFVRQYIKEHASCLITDEKQ